MLRLIAALTTVLLCASVVAAAQVTPVDTTSEGPRTLFIALDAVPFHVAAAVTDPALGDEALFSGLRQPATVISSFPSTTTISFAGMLAPFGADLPPGYEARFFDRQEDKIRGGGLVSYGKIEFSWREFFDFMVHGALRKAVGYSRPVKFGRKEIRKALQAFQESDKQQFWVYIGATDAIGHLKGPDELVAFLTELDAALDELRESLPEDSFRTVIFSDHGIAGGEPLINVRKGVRRAVKAEGFKIGKRLRKPDRMVFVPFGLLTSLVMFGAEGDEIRLARTVGSVEGLSLCAFETKFGWTISGADGDAYVRRRLRDGVVEWFYDASAGDPLDYRDVLEQLQAAPGMSGREWFPDQQWFEATVDARFPDALYRIAKAFDLVRNPASVVCSVAPGYMYGPKSPEISGKLTVGRLKWTHGALEREDTLGFLLTDVPGAEVGEFVRFDRTLIPFLDAAIPMEDRQGNR